MNATPTENWTAGNQRHLMAALAVVRAALERHAGSSGEPPADLEEAGAADQLSAPATLETLRASFALSPFECDVLLLCAGVELDSGFATCCAAAQGDPRRTRPTFSLALAARPEAHWSALSPGAPLRRWRLIEVGTGETLTGGPLRIDERVLHFLAGVSYLDERLQGIVEPIEAATELPPSHEAIARQITQWWSAADRGSGRPVVQLCGHDAAGKRMIAASGCAGLGLGLHGLRSGDIPAAAAEREDLARLWEREAVLSGSALLIDVEDRPEHDRTQAVLAFLESVAGPVILSATEPLSPRRRRVLSLDVPQPGAGERLELWRQELGPALREANGQLDAVAGQFRLDVRGVRAAGSVVRERLSEGRDDPLGPLLWDACRVQARTRLEGLAQRLEPAAVWEDLILPEPQLQLLREVAAHVRQRLKVYETWGFAARGTRGLGISALFAGASGTGKTMAAEVLANELRLDLFRIDLSAVVSKYIGETEKNLRRVFDAAEEGGSILLFDEADALFGKRSEVKDSHDRYANIEVSYLLQRMEAYRGLAILTTNMKHALDPAFLRRIRFVVQFPHPGAAQRAEIWRRIFPPATPTQGLDLSRLARLNVTGGNIRNIALGAAFLAADADEPVGMGHVLQAARSEYAKLEKPLTEIELAGGK